MAEHSGNLKQNPDWWTKPGFIHLFDGQVDGINIFKESCYETADIYRFPGFLAMRGIPIDVPRRSL